MKNVVWYSFYILVHIGPLLGSTCCQNCISQKCDARGICTEGCIAGYTDKYCQHPCQETCLNSTCYVEPNSGKTVCRDGCVAGYCGPRCKITCPDGCLSCDRSHCENCTLCRADLYGVNCEHSCLQKCDGFACNIEGTCLATCIDGRYGAHCNVSCPSTYQSCDRATGQCQQCKDGHFGDVCQHLCPSCLTPDEEQFYTCRSGCKVCGSQSPAQPKQTCPKQIESQKLQDISSTQIVVLVLITIAIIIIITITITIILAILKIRHTRLKWSKNIASSDPCEMQALNPGTTQESDPQATRREEETPMSETPRAPDTPEKQRLLGLTETETLSLDKTTNEDCDGDSNAETEEEEDAGSSRKLVPIQSFRSDRKERRVDVHVIVIGEPEMKTNTKMKAVVADKTSAVYLWIYNKSLFEHMTDQAGVILRNVKWNGRILEATNHSTANAASTFKIPEQIIADALGIGLPVSTKEANTLPDKTLMCLNGKVVKKSLLLIRPLFGSMLKHCQIKLRDDTGFVNVDVWGGAAETMKLGIVIAMTSCKKREPMTPDGPPFTTTPNTRVRELPLSELRHIVVKNEYRRGTIAAYHVDIASDITLASAPGLTTRVDVDIRGEKGTLVRVMVFWPQLIQLFELETRDNMETPSVDDKENIEKLLEKLRAKEIKYYAYGTVEKFEPSNR